MFNLTNIASRIFKANTLSIEQKKLLYMCLMMNAQNTQQVFHNDHFNNERA